MTAKRQAGLDTGRNTEKSGLLELQLRCMVRFTRAVYDDLRSGPGLPWNQRLAAWKSGFSANAWLLYKLAENDPDLYVSDLGAELQLYKINGSFNPVVSNKLVFSRLLSARQVPQPRVVSIIHHGQMFEEDARFDPDLPGTLARTLARYPRQVFRPTWCGRGHGVFFLDQGDDGLRLNGETVTFEKICAHLSKLDRYMVTAFQQQHPYAENIFPGSANTLRILTLWDIDAAEPYIAAVLHRFGTSRSAPIDNWRHGLGGLCSSVNRETAALGPAAWRLAGHDLAWESSHPETGSPIEGVIIPGLSECLDGVLDAARSLPFCPMIGWDVVMTQDSFSILEANTLPDLDIVQIHGPLLKDPRSRQFFHRWGLATEAQGTADSARSPN